MRCGCRSAQTEKALHDMLSIPRNSVGLCELATRKHSAEWENLQSYADTFYFSVLLITDYQMQWPVLKYEPLALYTVDILHSLS